MVRSYTMDNGQSQFSIRLPTALRDELHAEARRHNRSLNSEILKRLEFSMLKMEENRSEPEAFGKGDKGSDRELKALLQQMSRKIDGLQNYIDSEKFSANLFRKAFAYFAKK